MIWYYMSHSVTIKHGGRGVEEIVLKNITGGRIAKIHLHFNTPRIRNGTL